MFTGIVEALGVVEAIRSEGDNLHFRVSCAFSGELKIDQSVAHDGVCLTVVELHEGAHTVTAIRETLQRTTLGAWRVGDAVNMERAMRTGDRLDGHTVQGHVDACVRVASISEQAGSWLFTMEYDAAAYGHLLVDKGSVCLNGVSLTVVNPEENRFSVAIIPYTYAHTTFHRLRVGDAVNVEFDVIGKYIARYAALYLKK